MQKNKLSNFLGFAAIICFIICCLLFLRRFTSNTVYFDQLPSISQEKDIDLTPDGVEIKSTNVSLRVESIKVEKTFPTSSTSVLNIKDTNIYYGHNWPNLLGRVKKNQIGDEIKIHFTNGSVKSYFITKIESVWPSDTSILNSANNNQIILYTCTGIFDLKRLVLVATQ